MTQITPISKKNRRRQILILCGCLLALISCYDVDTLPDKIKSSYSFAIPIVDSTVSIGDFASLANYGALLEQVEIPEGTPIHMGEQEYPFYIGDYSPSQEIEWVEPHIIIDTKDLPSGTVVNIRIYIKNDYGEKVYFWLSENHSITLISTPVKVPETPQVITNIEQFRNARQIFLDTYLTYPATVSGAQIVNDKVNIKFAIKFAIKTDLKITL
jgi:hypothetical protein